MKNLVRLYNESQKEGADWYPQAKAFCHDLANRYGMPLETVAGILSALSPGTNWDRNKLETEWLIRLHKGEKVAKFKFTTYGANVIKGEKIAAGLSPYEAFKERTGPKTFHFFHCILGSAEHICIDRHAYAIATGEAYKGLTPKQYREVADHYRRAAKRLGITPSTLQAVLWVDYRNKLSKSLDTDVPF